MGVFLLLASATTYSTAGVFTKGVEVGVWAVIFWRGVFAGLITTIWVASRRTFHPEFTGMGWPGLAVGMIGAAGTATFITSFTLTSIANVAVIYAMAPLIAAAIAWILIGEKAGRNTTLGMVISIGGVVVLLAGSVGSVNLIGDGLALTMTFAMATIMVIYRAHPQTPSAGPSVAQSLFLLPIALMFGSPFDIAIVEIAVLAIFGMLFAIASVTLAEGAKRVPSGQAALLGTLETPLAPILAFLFLSEIPPNLTILGGAIVLVAILISVRQDKPKLNDNS